jgi:hypothetical protein
MDTPEILPEHESVEAFAEYLLAEERESFTYMEADTIGKGLKVATYVVIDGLKEFGFTYEGRASEKRVRGYRTSSLDRWFGPGASKSHGGSGHEQICGFAGQKG